MLTLDKAVTETGNATSGASDNNPGSKVNYVNASILEVDGSGDNLLNLNDGVPDDYEETEIEITMDSGAGLNVMPPDAVPGYVARSSAGSRSGKHFLAADGQGIENEGEADVELTNAEGRNLASTFQFANITRPLYGTGPVCDNNSTCIFTATECRVIKGPIKVVGGQEVVRFH